MAQFEVFGTNPVVLPSRLLHEPKTLSKKHVRAKTHSLSPYLAYRLSEARWVLLQSWKLRARLTLASRVATQDGATYGRDPEALRCLKQEIWKLGSSGLRNRVIIMNSIRLSSQPEPKTGNPGAL